MDVELFDSQNVFGLSSLILGGNTSVYYDRLCSSAFQEPYGGIMPGKKYRSLKKPKVYEALKKKGMSKKQAARISNAMAKKEKAKKKKESSK